MKHMLLNRLPLRKQEYTITQNYSFHHEKYIQKPLTQGSQELYVALH